MFLWVKGKNPLGRVSLGLLQRVTILMPHAHGAMTLSCSAFMFGKILSEAMPQRFRERPGVAI